VNVTAKVEIIPAASEQACSSQPAGADMHCDAVALYRPRLLGSTLVTQGGEILVHVVVGHDT
jgi:hypothetical protein